MKIYTKKGDEGETSLMGSGPVSKDVPRVQAYGEVDELNSLLGWALTQLSEGKLKDSLIRIQEQLFALGAELATPNPSENQLKGYVQGEHIRAMEIEIDDWEASLPPLKEFILPGGSPGGAALHLARAVCRRAERCLVALHQQEPLRPEALAYLNRLSDWLFVLARTLNHQAGVGEVSWKGRLK